MSALVLAGRLSLNQHSTEIIEISTFCNVQGFDSLLFG